MKKNKILLLFIIIGLLLFGYLGYRVYNDFFSNQNNVKEIDSLELYGYSLTSNDNDTFKTEFENLRKILNEKTINYEDYAKSVSKLFIIDLYTISNKLGSTDIGGTEFLHTDLVENFKENVGSTLYKNVETNIYGDRNQELPEVKEVTINSIEEIKYKYNDIEYNGYLVKASWTYIKDLGYIDKLNISLIKDNNKLFIVKGD